jgi:hypothetical protein
MTNKVVIVNAFEPVDFFIAQLSKEYENALKERNIIPEILFVNTMNFSFTPFPEQYSFDTLEYDLQKTVKAIKNASTVAFFTSTRKDKPMPIFGQLVSRLFHLKSGMINSDIWGNVSAYSKVLRIITVLDDPEIWAAFHNGKNISVVPMPKISFGLFGFGQVFSRTFGYLKESDVLNNYAKKSLKAMRDMAEKD